MKTLFTLMALCLSFLVMAQDREFHLDEVYKIDTEGIVHMETDDEAVTIIGSQRNDVHIVIDWTLHVEGMARGGKTFRAEVKERNGDLHFTAVGTGKL